MRVESLVRWWLVMDYLDFGYDAIIVCYISHIPTTVLCLFYFLYYHHYDSSRHSYSIRWWWLLLLLLLMLLSILVDKYHKLITIFDNDDIGIEQNSHHISVDISNMYQLYHPHYTSLVQKYVDQKRNSSL